MPPSTEAQVGVNYNKRSNFPVRLMVILVYEKPEQQGLNEMRCKKPQEMNHSEIDALTPYDNMSKLFEL